MEKTKHLLTQKGTGHDKHLLWLTLNNPERKNAISLEMIELIEEQLCKAAQDPEIRVVILRSNSSAFCAGGDIKEMDKKEGMFAGGPATLRQNYKNGIQRIPLAIEHFPKPIIAVVDGAAIGAGLDLALMCDLRVASTRATFAESFAKLALVPGDGGTYFLSRIVGYARAMEMILTAKTLDATLAKEWGMINILTTPEKIEQEALALALSIASHPPLAIQLSKEALKRAQRSDLLSQLDLLATYQGITQNSRDHREAIDAFFQKRSPQFIGE